MTQDTAITRTQIATVRLPAGPDGVIIHNNKWRIIAPPGSVWVLTAEYEGDEIVPESVKPILSVRSK